mgnify:CR=1 FL=1
MHILITGAAGMIGRKLTERLAISRELNGQPVDRLTLIDVVAPQRLASFSDHEKTRAADLAEPGVAAKAVSERPDVIFHLAGVVSGEAETNMEKGYRVNLDGSRALLEAIRAVGDGYKPRVIFTSSMAVYGAPFKEVIEDDFHLTPLTSYGTQKMICEAMLAGRAVVATDVGSVREVVEDGVTGLVVRPDDEAGLTAAIRALLDDPGRRRAMGAAGRARAEAAFTVGAMARQYESV